MERVTTVGKTHPFRRQRHPRPLPSYEDLTFEQVMERLEEIANPRPPGEPNGHELTVVVPTAAFVRELMDQGWALILKDRFLLDLPGPARKEAASRLFELALRALARVEEPVPTPGPNGVD